MKIDFGIMKKLARIEDVVSEYITLIPIAKNRLRGLCPFHDDSNPSFTVYIDTQSFYCFGCGIGGNVINFLKKIKNIDSAQAIRELKRMKKTF
jgi:DNA primase